MEGIREFEKNILTEMDFIDRYLNIELKFIKNNSDKILKCDKKTFMAMVDAKYQIKHEGGAYYTITKNYNKYEFVLEIQKTSGAGLLFYIYIYMNQILQNVDLSPVAAALDYLPYNKAKAEKVSNTFGYNTLSEMKDYLNQMITLWEEFVEKYIEKLELG
ncbi:hypothetical protein, partial [Mesonia oceanica]